MGFGSDIVQFAIRTWTFIFTLLTMALVGNAIAIQLYSNASVNFAMFVSVLAMVALIIWVICRVASLPVVVTLIADGLAMLFSLLAGIILPARLHVHSCNNVNYLIRNGLTQGMEQRCRELQASTAFFWFMWLGFLASLIVSFADRGSSSLTSRRNGSSTPAMSQV